MYVWVSCMVARGHGRTCKPALSTAVFACVWDLRIPMTLYPHVRINKLENQNTTCHIHLYNVENQIPLVTFYVYDPLPAFLVKSQQSRKSNIIPVPYIKLLLLCLCVLVHVHAHMQDIMNDVSKSPFPVEPLHAAATGPPLFPHCAGAPDEQAIQTVRACSNGHEYKHSLHLPTYQ